MSEKKQEELSFEAAMKRLEELVDIMESGSADLDSMVAAFEEGQKLVQHCTAKLNEIEKRVEKIVIKNNNEVTTEPFELNE